MLIAFLALLIGLPAAPEKRPPQAAVGAFVSVNYAITFRAPPQTTYCPVPENWTGSDHGTVIFLEPPRFCGGVGFPSNSRGFEPNVPRFEVYYGLDLTEDADHPVSAPKCNRVGKLVLLNKDHVLCRSFDRHRVVLWSRATYSAISAAEVVLTLVTTPRRLSKDLLGFRAFAATVHSCKQFDERLKGPASSWGLGPQCQKGNWY